uniref:Rad21_Rec8 domain-containing protein n=1 Tax=Bursaphelenchus xylophilus TaxID=6326 RepID=A0A1I7S6X5_BURXY
MQFVPKTSTRVSKKTKRDVSEVVIGEKENIPPEIVVQLPATQTPQQGQGMISQQSKAMNQTPQQGQGMNPQTQKVAPQNAQGTQDVLKRKLPSRANEAKPAKSMDQWVVKRCKLNVEANKVESVTLFLRSAMVPFLQQSITFRNEALFQRLAALVVGEVIEVKDYKAYNTYVTIFGEGDVNTTVQFQNSADEEEDMLI